MSPKNNPKSDANELPKTDPMKGGKSTDFNSASNTQKSKSSIDQPASDAAKEALKNSGESTGRLPSKEGYPADNVAENAGKAVEESAADAIKNGAQSAESMKFKDGYKSDKIAENVSEGVKKTAVEVAKNTAQSADGSTQFKEGYKSDKVAENAGKAVEEGVDVAKHAGEFAERVPFKDSYSSDKVAKNAGKAVEESTVDTTKNAAQSAESMKFKDDYKSDKVAENAVKAVEEGVDVAKHAGESAESVPFKEGYKSDKVTENAGKAVEEGVDIAKHAGESAESVSFKEGYKSDKVAENEAEAGSTAKDGIKTDQSSVDFKKGDGGGKGITEGIGKSSAQVSQPKTSILKNLIRALKSSKFALPTIVTVATIAIAGGIYLGTKVIPPKADTGKMGVIITPRQSESGSKSGKSDEPIDSDSPQENSSLSQVGGSEVTQTDLSGWWIFTGTLTTNNPEEDAYKYDNWQIEVIQEGTSLKGYDGDGHEVIDGTITGTSIEFFLHIDHQADVCGDFSNFQGSVQSNNGVPTITGNLTGHDCEYSSEWEGEFTIDIIK